MIQPLPAAIAPSQQFIDKMRAELLEAATGARNPSRLTAPQERTPERALRMMEGPLSLCSARHVFCTGA